MGDYDGVTMGLRWGTIRGQGGPKGPKWVQGVQGGPMGSKGVQGALWVGVVVVGSVGHAALVDVDHGCRAARLIRFK